MKQKKLLEINVNPVKSPVESEKSETDSETEKPTPKKVRQEFQCMNSAPLVKVTDNSLIIQELQKLYDRHQAEGERWRALSYTKVFSV
jgi:hypothetical protein